MTLPILIRHLLFITLSLPIVLGLPGCAKDKEPPVMRLGAPDSLDWPQATPFVASPIVAFDKQDFDLSDQVQVGGNLDVSRVGNYKVIYSATDLAGNSAEIEQFVHVYPTTAGMFGYYRSASSCSSCPSQGHTRITRYQGTQDRVILRPVMGDSSGTNTSNMRIRVEDDGDLVVESCTVPCGYSVDEVIGYSSSDSIFMFFKLYSLGYTYCSTVYVRE
jgi:hypothetical protein